MLARAAPAEAVRLAALAELAGFDGIIAGDHFQPYLPQHGQAGHLWSALGALGARTQGVFGGITTPGFRSHPAVVAQAAATLASMYGPRYWLGLASGEALNEHVVGDYWPEAPERIARMFEALEIVTKLFGSRNRDVRHAGQHFKLEATRLWTMPSSAPRVLIATSGPVTARRAGRVADGLVTVEGPPKRLEHLVHRFRQGVMESGRAIDQPELAVQVHVSWAPDDAEALRQALEHWPHGGIRFPTADVRSPFELAQMARYVRPEDLPGHVLVAADLDAHRAHLQSFADLGFTRIYVHQVGQDQDGFRDAYARNILGTVRR